MHLKREACCRLCQPAHNHLVQLCKLHPYACLGTKDTLYSIHCCRLAQPTVTSVLAVNNSTATTFATHSTQELPKDSSRMQFNISALAAALRGAVMSLTSGFPSHPQLRAYSTTGQSRVFHHPHAAPVAQSGAEAGRGLQTGQAGVAVMECQSWSCTAVLEPLAAAVHLRLSPLAAFHTPPRSWSELQRLATQLPACPHLHLIP